SRPLPLLKLPPKPGESWQSLIKDRDNGRVVERRGVYLVGEDDVKVPLATYKKAITLSGEISTGGVRREEFTFWFADGGGMVKQRVRVDGKTAVYERKEHIKP